MVGGLAEQTLLELSHRLPTCLQPLWRIRGSHPEESPTKDATTDAKPQTDGYGIGNTPEHGLSHTY